MNIADELAEFETRPGIRCGVDLLAETYPAECRDLWEAIRSPEPGSVVSRWWNQTRADTTGLQVTPQTVRRHRNRIECTQCR